MPGDPVLVQYCCKQCHHRRQISQDALPQPLPARCCAGKGLHATVFCLNFALLGASQDIISPLASRCAGRSPNPGMPHGYRVRSLHADHEQSLHTCSLGASSSS